MAFEIPPITTEPIDFQAFMKASNHPKAGAIVWFSGAVRNHNEGRAVRYLSYECYAPMAEKMIREILAEACERYNLHFALCQHRVGRVEIGEAAVVTVTGASHRDAAYTANRYIIDRVKYEVPIWKRELFEDGEEVWAHNSGERFEG